MQRSCYFRLKVRGERLKAGSFYRFALNYFYVVRPRGGCCYSCYSCASRTSSTRGGKAAEVLGDTRQVCRGQNRPWDTRRSNAESSTDGGSARDTHECAGRSFSLSDYPNNIRGNGHRKESDPIPILCLSYSEIPIKFQSGSNEVPMEIGGQIGGKS